MGLPRVRDAESRYLDIPRYARVMCAVAASAAGVDWIDTVYTDIADLDGLRRECEDGVAMGFSGKISIHPSQIEVINAAFTPVGRRAGGGARARRAVRGARAARPLRVPVQGPDGGCAAPDARPQGHRPRRRVTG